MRLRELDSIRGIAAGLIVFTHADLIVSSVAPWTWMAWPPFRYIPLARAPVMVFFVLSGFVLTVSLTQPELPTFGQFVVRRFCRIYLPFLAAIIFSIACFYIVRPTPLADQSGWFNGTWFTGVTVRVLAGHILMLGRFRDANLDNVVWSLWYELRISFLLPFLIAVTRMLGPVLAIAVFSVFAIAIEISLIVLDIGEQPFYSSNTLEAFLITAHFIPLFLIGMLAALHSTKIIAGFSKFTGSVRFALWILSFVLLNQPNDIVMGFGAFIIICLALSAKQTRWLLLPPVQWLGRVSFSLYLIHLPILIGFYHALHGYLAPNWIMLIAVAASLLLAEIAYRLIEYPSIRLGRLLTSRRPALVVNSPSQ